MTIINESKLDSWVKRNYNVLFEGRHGIGKTAIILNTFTRNGLVYKYFSGPTLDPWVDIIGIPTKNEKSGFLDFITSQDFAEDNYDVIFIDELNRAHKKVKDAVMEFIQFKTINGRKFKRLKAIWGAINPKDDSNSKIVYQVEKLDPALEDRFHVHVYMTYAVDYDYFQRRYGEAGTIACEWWDKLDKDVKENISPRRLDYLVDHILIGDDPYDIVPREANTGANISDLLLQLEGGSFSHQLTMLMNAPIEKKKIKFSNDNFYHGTYKLVIADPVLAKQFLHAFPYEKLATLLTDDEKIFELMKNHDTPTDFKSVVNPILKLRAIPKRDLLQNLRKWAEEFNLLQSTKEDIEDLIYMQLTSRTEVNAANNRNIFITTLAGGKDGETGIDFSVSNTEQLNRLADTFFNYVFGLPKISFTNQINSRLTNQVKSIVAKFTACNVDILDKTNQNIEITKALPVDEDSENYLSNLYELKSIIENS